MPISLFTATARGVTVPPPPPNPNHERQTTTPGTTYENFFTRLISFIFIAKMGHGFVCKIYNFGVLYKCNKPFGKEALRWLDTVFQGQYLPSLSVNYVAINKVLEKLPPQMY